MPRARVCLAVFFVLSSLFGHVSAAGLGVRREDVASPDASEHSRMMRRVAQDAGTIVPPSSALKTPSYLWANMSTWPSAAAADPGTNSVVVGVNGQAERLREIHRSGTVEIQPTTQEAALVASAQPGSNTSGRWEWIPNSTQLPGTPSGYSWNGTQNVVGNIATNATGTTANNDVTIQNTGYTPPANARRRRTDGLIWDCDFEANWLSGMLPDWEMVVPMESLTAEERAHPETWCKEKCINSATTCTGFYIYEQGTVPGQGTQKCGLFTTDMNEGTKQVKHNTASGFLCLRVGKNFECSTENNMISNAQVRADFEMQVPPSGTVSTNAEALAWCKHHCDEDDVRCKTFWFQQWSVQNDYGTAADWKCGFYANPVEASLRMFESDQDIASGMICDAV